MRHIFRTVFTGAALALLAILLSPTPLPAADWPQFRGPLGLATSADKNLPTTWSATENIVWKTELPGAGTSSPILLGDKIFLTTYSGFNVPGDRGSMENLKLHVVCLNRHGKILWTTDFDPKLPEQEKIRDDHGYASSTPVADADRVYVFFGKSGVVALDHDGKKIWHADVGSKLNGWGSGASLVLHKDLLLVNASVESESLVALDKHTGREVWRAKGIREAWNTPLIVQTEDGKTEISVAIPHKILGFDPDTGKQLWSCATGIFWYMAPSMVAHDGVIYSIGGRSGGGLAVKSGGEGDVTESHRVWLGKKGSNVTSPIYHDGHIYWMHEALGIAYCAKADTGEIVYEERVPRSTQVYASPVLADGKIYYLTRDGKMFVVAAKPEFELLATNTLGERGTYNASPAIANSRLYLRTNKNLYCIGAPK
jgi:outer membrane protein assembly factor BamB